MHGAQGPRPQANQPAGLSDQFIQVCVPRVSLANGPSAALLSVLYGLYIVVGSVRKS